MRSETLWGFIYMGTSLRYLQDIKFGSSIHDEFSVLYNVDSFLNNLDKFNLNVTKRASIKLEKIKENLSKKNQKAKLNFQESEEIRKIISDIRKTLNAEALGQFVYRVSDKRLDVVKLLNNISELFAPDIFKSCPDIARYDFQEAGNCIAFERPTAAAFHLLRGTEAVLRVYYQKFIISTKKDPLWGDIIKELRLKDEGNIPDPILINNLDNLRNSFRNPTQHPQKIYDIEEAQDLFHLCIEVVNRMGRTLK